MRHRHNVLLLGSDILKCSFFPSVFFFYFKNSLLLELNSELLPFKNEVMYSKRLVFDMGERSLNKFNMP